MFTYYYRYGTIPTAAYGFITTDDVVAPSWPGSVLITSGEYFAEEPVSQLYALSRSLTLRVSRSVDRINPVDLHQATLDNGKLYAIYVPDIPELGITQVEFFLNAVSFHTESSAPWDYNGTDGFGKAIRIPASTGTYTIDAVVTWSYDTTTVIADLEVD